MDSTPTDEVPDGAPDGAPDGESLCSYPGCGAQRFAQNSFCTTHYQKMSWALDRSWYEVTRWARWIGAIVVAAIVVVLFI
jgi:hypothetical protein